MSPSSISGKENTHRARFPTKPSPAIGSWPTDRFFGSCAVFLRHPGGPIAPPGGGGVARRSRRRTFLPHMHLLGPVYIKGETKRKPPRVPWFGTYPYSVQSMGPTCNMQYAHLTSPWAKRGTKATHARGVHGFQFLVSRHDSNLVSDQLEWRVSPCFGTKTRPKNGRSPWGVSQIREGQLPSIGSNCSFSPHLQTARLKKKDPLAHTFGRTSSMRLPPLSKLSGFQRRCVISQKNGG